MIDDKHDYKLYQMQSVSQDINEVILKCNQLHTLLTSFLQDKDTTAAYWRYNIFSLTSSSVLFYNIWKELSIIVREHVGDSRPLWMSGWLNCHRYNEVLDWHNHHLSVVHGYISVDPKDTVTEFEDYTIQNKPGQLYLGPAGRIHRVVNKSTYSDRRITIGFDVGDRQEEYIQNLAAGYSALIPVF